MSKFFGNKVQVDGETHYVLMEHNQTLLTTANAEEFAYLLGDPVHYTPKLLSIPASAPQHVLEFAQELYDKIEQEDVLNTGRYYDILHTTAAEAWHSFTKDEQLELVLETGTPVEAVGEDCINLHLKNFTALTERLFEEVTDYEYTALLSMGR